jgi:hypothetical protein
MAYDVDPEQSVSIVAVFLFIDAAFIGFPVLQALVRGGFLSPLAVALVVGLIAAGVGLLKGLRWAWWLAMAVIGLTAVFDLLGFNLIGLAIDALVLFLLTRPSTRARFGVR